jgi:hypothetical protein
MSSWWTAQCREGEGEDGPNGGGFDDEAEDLFVVYSRAQSEALKDPTSLVRI